MNKIYLFFNNLQTGTQIIIWLLCFYWLDFELFTFILNDFYFMKIILGIILISCQLFLYQNLYHLIKIDSIFEPENNSELQNINEKHDYTTCKKCNILRPKRAHHCRYCNKCILKMNHHCFTLNKCIGKKNYKYFIKYLTTAEINTSFIFWISIYVCINYYSELTLMSLIKYGFLIFASFMGSLSIFFYLLFHLYLHLSKLTTLEFIYPKSRIKQNIQTIEIFK